MGELDGDRAGKSLNALFSDSRHFAQHPHSPNLSSAHRGAIFRGSIQIDESLQRVPPTYFPMTDASPLVIDGSDSSPSGVMQGMMNCVDAICVHVASLCISAQSAIAFSILANLGASFGA